MKTTRLRSRSGAFTLIEMLTVCAIIGILAAMLMPVLSQGKATAKRIQCVNDLRQTGLSYQLFANDHGGRYPTHVSTNDGGAIEYVTLGYQLSSPFYFSYQLFLPVAGELSTPSGLACPSDLDRLPGRKFSEFDNWNLSYVIGLRADPNLPTTILAGDRTLPTVASTNSVSPTIGYLPPPNPYWERGLHNRKGNLLFSDDHVEESNDARALEEETEAEDVFYPDVDESSAPTEQFAAARSANNSSVNPYASYYSQSPAYHSSPADPTPQSSSPAYPATSHATGAAQTLSASSGGSGQPGHAPASEASHAAATRTGDSEPVGTEHVTEEKKGTALGSPATKPEPRIAHTSELAFPTALAQTASESWHATSWLIWLLLLFLALYLVARRLDRRQRDKRAKPEEPPRNW